MYAVRHHENRAISMTYILFLQFYLLHNFTKETTISKQTILLETSVVTVHAIGSN
jgi:hypothetical protein